jgi:hypothetical protein
VKRFIKLLPLVGLVLGALALAPNASAHGATPTALECAVNGSVTTNFQTYNFVQSSLTCAGSYEGAVASGVYSVTASGSTKSNIGGPETCNEGTSAAPGSLSANRVSGSGPSSLSGAVTFVRAGTGVVANGTLTDANGHQVTFAALMQFTPNPPTQLTGCVGGTPSTFNALLTGAATVVDKNV